MVKKETLFLNGSVILLSSPLSASIAPYPSPLSVSTRGPQYLKAFGFPIKDFGNDGGASLLNGSTRSLQCLKAFGFPIKYFRHNKIKGIFSHPSFLNASL
jgi:hypothetical protein